MPLTEDETTSWLNKIHPDRMNSRILGNLGGRSLARAKRLVNAALGNLPPESIEIKEDMELGSDCTFGLMISLKYSRRFYYSVIISIPFL
jgi:hypothetical protein